MAIYHSKFNQTSIVLSEFAAAYGRGARRKLLRLGRKRTLKSFFEAEQAYGNGSRTARGIQSIPVDRIVGSVSMNVSFDDRFNPRCIDSQERWTRLYRGFVNGDPIPPISVYKVGEEYFVEDGHHRVSVARAVGQISIEATVIEIGISPDTVSDKTA